MAKGILLALSNPSTADRDKEYNAWYDNIHAAEVTALPGVAGMTRYRAAVQMNPPSDEPLYRYCAIYQLDDVEAALGAFGAAAQSFQLSDAMDLKNALVVAFEPIFTYQKSQ